MNVSSLTASDLRRISHLLESKGSLKAQLAEIERELGNFGSAAPAAAAPAATTGARRGRKPGRPAKAAAPAPARKGGRMKRGQLKDTIIGLLKSAGKEGLSVRDLADKMKVNPANIHVWFGSTGKKISQIRKSNGKRVWVG